MTTRAVEDFEKAWLLLAGEGALPARSTGPWSVEETHKSKLLGFMAAAADDIKLLADVLQQPSVGGKLTRDGANLADAARRWLAEAIRVVQDDADRAAMQVFVDAHGELRAEDNLIAHWPRWYKSLRFGQRCLRDLAALLGPYPP